MKDLKIGAVFRIDALGALLSAGLILFVIRSHYQIFGLKPNFCDGLGLVAALFFGYSLSCSFWAHKTVYGKQLVQIISIANTLYALVVMLLLILEWDLISRWAIAYFGGELCLILTLAYLEWSYSKTYRPI